MSEFCYLNRKVKFSYLECHLLLGEYTCVLMLALGEIHPKGGGAATLLALCSAQHHIRSYGSTWGMIPHTR